MDEIDAIAADIAAKGLARAAELEAGAALLRERLADPAFLRARAEAQLRVEQEKFAWETEEDFPADVRPTIWAAQTDYFATGEGLTTYYFATLARSEAEFRRKFARRVDSYLVEAAQLYDRLRTWAKKQWGGKDRPGAFSFFAERHVNYS